MAEPREGTIAAARGLSGDGGLRTKRRCLPAPRPWPDRPAAGRSAGRGPVAVANRPWRLIAIGTKPPVGAACGHPDLDATGSTETEGHGGSHGLGTSGTVCARTAIDGLHPRSGHPDAPTNAVRGGVAARRLMVARRMTRMADSHAGTARRGRDEHACVPLLLESLGPWAGMSGDIGAGAAPRR
jgi:hypothetical protein